MIEERHRNVPMRDERIIVCSEAEYVSLCLDDIATFSESRKGHTKHARLGLHILRDAGVTLKLQKFCLFHQPSRLPRPYG